MIKRNLQQIENMTEGTLSHVQFGAKESIGVCTDSRNILKGSLFIPLVGANFNGHKFVEQAIEDGAVAALWQHSEANPPKDVPLIFVDDTLLALQRLAVAYRNELSVKVVGITGSNGKTSTKDILASILSTTFKVQKTQGNFNNHIGLPLTILQLEEDTEISILEMGMSGFGEIQLLSEIGQPDAAIITNIGEAHLQDLGSREGIATAKYEIVAGLRNDGLFVYHGDEPLLQAKVAGEEVSFRTETFGESEQNDWYPTSIEITHDGTQFTLNQCDGVFFIPIIGKHQVLNALATMSVARDFGVTFDDMKKGLQQLQMTGMRMEVQRNEAGVTVINDAYNASPTSMKAALQSLENMKGQYEHIYVVLGDMLELGDGEEEFHREVGACISSDVVTDVFTFGPRGRWIGEGALANFGEDRVHIFEDKEALIHLLKQKVNEKDVVLIKGSRGVRLEEVGNALLK